MDPDDWSYTRWKKAPRVPFSEKFELFVFRAITWIPVVITFTIFAYLFGFYMFVSTNFMFPLNNF